MATSTSINGTSYSSFEAAFVAGALTAGTYTALAPYGSPPREGSAEYEEMLITFLGISGVGRKFGEFRGRNITIDIVIVGASKSACETSRNTLLGTMLPPTSRFSVTVPNGTARAGCTLVRGSGQVREWQTLDGKILALLTLDIRQLSETN